MQSDKVGRVFGLNTVEFLLGFLVYTLIATRRQAFTSYSYWPDRFLVQPVQERKVYIVVSIE